MMADPATAEDIDVLEKYLTSNLGPRNLASKAFLTVPRTSGESVVYVKLPRRRPRLQSGSAVPGKAQREVMQRVLYSCDQEIIDLYFQVIHPCFPILDEKTSRDLYKSETDQISSTLVCQIFAISLSYWSSSSTLHGRPSPDVAFAWNQAVAALSDDFVAPSMASICSGLLQISGRPVNQVTNNVGTLGRVVTLAYSLGFHRSPMNWKISEAEKGLRIRLWWGVLIHDCWSSYAHGTPPTISRGYHDVPLPLDDPGSEVRLSSFYHLCLLTRILARILPIVYSLRSNYDDMWKEIRAVEHMLDEWELHLPDGLRHMLEAPDNDERTSGSSSLHCCFLAVRMLVCRVALRIASKSTSTSISAALSYRKVLLQESAAAMALYITDLKDSQLKEFWLSHLAHILASVTIVLLRGTVETSDDDTKRSGAAVLVALMQRLRTAQQFGWDMADFCLDRCADSVDKVAATIQSEGRTSTARAHEDSVQDVLETLIQGEDGIDLPFDLFDDTWNMLWDDDAFSTLSNGLSS